MDKAKWLAMGMIKPMECHDLPKLHDEAASAEGGRDRLQPMQLIVWFTVHSPPFHWAFDKHAIVWIRVNL